MEEATPGQSGEPLIESGAQDLSAAPAESPGHFPVKLALALTLCLTFLAYCRTLAFGFVYDDRGQIVNNPYLRSWHYVGRFFTSQVWSFNDPSAVGNYYRPVFLLWLLVNRMVFGLHPLFWHLANILLHVAVTALAFVIVRELARDNITGIVAALVFGLHPIHVESVAWISADTDPLAAFWVFLAFWAYLRWRKNPGVGWLAASLAAYTFGMLSKETALVLPILLLGYEWIWEDRSPGVSWVVRWRARIRNWFVRLSAFAAVTLVYLAVRWRALSGLGHVLTPLKTSTIVMTWPSVLVIYLRRLVWPFGLSAFYDVPYVTRPSVGGLLLPLVILAIVAALIVIWAKRAEKSHPGHSRLIFFGCVWMLAPLLPLADLAVLPKDSIVHDRYLYFSSLGFALLVALAIRSIRGARKTVYGLPPWQWAAVCGAVAMLGVATSVQGQYWSNDLLFYARGVADLPNNNILRTNLANVLAQDGQYAESVRLYRQVLARDNGSWSPNDTITHVNLANVLALSGHDEDAIGIYQYVIEHNPFEWDANYNLGFTDYKVGRLKEAEKYLRRAIAINDLHANQYLYLGLTLLKLNRVGEAEANFRRAIRLKPNGFAYHLALGLVLNLEGKPAEALKQFQIELANYPAETAARDQMLATERLLHSGSANPPSARSAAGQPPSRPSPHARSTPAMQGNGAR